MVCRSAKFLTFVVLSATLCGPSARSQTVIGIDVTKPGVRVSPMLYGIFFEEISRAGDGGLYAEMLENRSFEDFDLPVGWSLQVASSDRATMALDQSLPLDPENPTSLRLEVKKLARGSRVALVNQGFKGAFLLVHDPVFKLEDAQRFSGTEPYAEWLKAQAVAQTQPGNGLVVAGGKKYKASLWMRTADGLNPVVTLSLETQAGGVLASASVHADGAGWQRYEVELQSLATDANARFVLALDRPGTVWVDMVSLFPKDTFRERENGLRADLMEMLLALHPAFVRFPGGSYSEGYTLRGAYRWKETIGDLAKRPGHWDIWGYRSSDGLGFGELLQMSEDLGAEPLYVPNCGIAEKEMANPLAQKEWVQDALDAVEYAKGGVETKWGAERVKAGHPKPFAMSMLEIGNENGMGYSWGGGDAAEYARYYVPFYRSVKTRYPEMTTIATAPIQQEPISAPVDVVDEHFYPTAQWFEEHVDRYDTYPRSGPKVYVGEYAAREGAGHGNIGAALGEAAFMTGMERNSDVVVMSSYAPLLANAFWKSWEPDAIVFDSATAYGTPSYYNQMLFANNRPDVILPLSMPKTGSLFAVAGKLDSTGDVIVKLVNSSAAMQELEIKLRDVSTVSYVLQSTRMMAVSAVEENSFAQPKKISPVALPEQIVDAQFPYEVPAYSITVLRLKRKVEKP